MLLTLFKPCKQSNNVRLYVQAPKEASLEKQEHNYYM